MFQGNVPNRQKIVEETISVLVVEGVGCDSGRCAKEANSFHF